MKYSEAFDIVDAAIQQRKHQGYRYPDGAARLIALVAMNAKDASQFVDWCARGLDNIEKPFFSNPAWDGSIG